MKKGEPLKPMLQKIDEDKEHKDDYLVNLKSLKCKEYPFLSTSEVHVKEIYPSLKFDGSFSSGKTKDEVIKYLEDNNCTVESWSDLSEEFVEKWNASVGTSYN